MVFMFRTTSIPLVMFFGVKTNSVSFIPASGDRSDTGVSLNTNRIKDIPLPRSGDRSATFV